MFAVCSVESFLFFYHYVVLPCLHSAPRIDVVKDKPVVSYVGDTAVIECKMKNKDINPNTWHWFRGNVTEKVRSAAFNTCFKLR